MRGNKWVTVGMLTLFVMSILSLWVTIPVFLIKGLSVLIFLVSAVNNCRYYRMLKGRHSKLLCVLSIACVFAAGISTVTNRFLWQVLYVVSLYVFFIFAELLIYGKFSKSYLLLGTSVVFFMVVNVYVDNAWVRKSVLGLQVILLVRLLNPFLEYLAAKGKQKQSSCEVEVSCLKKILFGRGGKLHFPRIRS